MDTLGVHKGPKYPKPYSTNSIWSNVTAVPYLLSGLAQFSLQDG